MPLRFILFIVLFGIHSSAAPTKIACVGDSITEGGHLASPAVESYPARLQRLLGTNDFEVRNFGVRGCTMLKRGDKPFWTFAAFTNSQTFNPELVIIQLGTNDSDPLNWEHGTNFISDYREMIEIYESLPSAPRIFLCTPCPVFGDGIPNVSPGNIRTNIAPAIRTLAGELSLPLIDLHSRMTNSSWFPDTIHPDTRGMSVMAAIMFDAVLGGDEAEEFPEVKMERLSGSRILLSWPAKAAGFVARTATAVESEDWIVLREVPFKMGDTIRQTNEVADLPQRFFQLVKP